MLENWVWDKKVLDSFASDYRDPSKRIPADIQAKLKEARLATEGTRYRRQLSFGLTDLALHTQIHDANAKEALPLSNKVLSEVFLPVAPDTAFVAYFGHLMGSDAGYYGYAWADAIAADGDGSSARSRLLRPGGRRCVWSTTSRHRDVNV
jgi:thimet oligopeptidase